MCSFTIIDILYIYGTAKETDQKVHRAVSLYHLKKGLYSMGKLYNLEGGITVSSDEVGDGTSSMVYSHRYYEISNNPGASNSLVKLYENFIHAQSPQNNYNMV